MCARHERAPDALMGRGGPRRGAGRRPATTAATVNDAARTLEALVAQIRRPTPHRNRAEAETLARQLFRDAMRLRRRLLRTPASDPRA